MGRTLAFTMLMPMVISVMIAIASFIYAKISKKTSEKYKEPFEEMKKKVAAFKFENRVILEAAMDLNKLKEEELVTKIKEKKTKRTPGQRRASLIKSVETKKIHGADENQGLAKEVRSCKDQRGVRPRDLRAKCCCCHIRHKL